MYFIDSIRVLEPMYISHHVTCPSQGILNNQITVLVIFCLFNRVKKIFMNDIVWGTRQALTQCVCLHMFACHSDGKLLNITGKRFLFSVFSGAVF